MKQFATHQFPVICALLLMVLLGFCYQLAVVPPGMTVFQPLFAAEFSLFALGALAVIFLFQRGRKDLLPFYEAMLLIFVIYVCIILFSSQKSLISSIIPYQYDLFLSQADKAVHFGRYPHEILRVASWPSWLVALVDKFYLAWFFVIYAWMACVLIFQNDTCRKQIAIISFCLIWLVVGNVAATIGSSVGPTFWSLYYKELPDPYISLTDHLRSVNEQYKLFALLFKNALIEMQNDGHIIDINAPSAMPSVHVGMTFLIFLTLPPRFTLLRIMMLAFLIIVMIGSVALGWHYAIDGYVAILLTWIVYYLTRTGVETYHGFIRNRQNPA